MEIKKMFGGFFRGKTVMLTGHTGFKGKWMQKWLEMLGADVYGYSLPSSINNYETVMEAVDHLTPDIVIHMAAVAQVIPSLGDPFGTFRTNVVGTFNVLEACRSYDVQNCLVVSSDKVYSNTGSLEGKMHDVNSRISGGLDPYSGSKAAADVLTHEYRKQMPKVIVDIVRAGNVIGGGDQSTHRLIPNLIESFVKKEPIKLRSPGVVRPWQHVLDVTHAYLSIIEHSAGSTWNVGPDECDATVRQVCNRMSALWNNRDHLLELVPKNHMESESLRLDSKLTKDRLGVSNLINLEGATYLTAEWYNAMLRDGTDMTETQIQRYCEAVQFLRGLA